MVFVLIEIVPHKVVLAGVYLWQFSVLCLLGAGPQLKLMSECIFSVILLFSYDEAWISDGDLSENWIHEKGIVQKK